MILLLSTALCLLLASGGLVVVKFKTHLATSGNGEQKLEPVTSIMRPIPLPDYREMLDFLLVYEVGGQKMITAMRMEVGFTNNGTSDIYVITGCGSTLNSTITSGEAVISTIVGGARCLCAEALSPVHSGQMASEWDPGCWSGYYYQVLGSGTFSARLVLEWYPSPSFGVLPSSVVIDATFTIP
jgi:hypothetical protein